MYLSERLKIYLDMFMTREGYIASRLLAVRAGVTERTVKSDMKKLNEFLGEYGAGIVSRTGAGYMLRSPGRAGEELSLLLAGMESEKLVRQPDGREERAEYIARKFLAVDYYVTMEELRQKLYISRSTLNGDMKQVRRLFGLYGLKLVHASHRGMCLRGSEEAIRRLTGKLFLKDWDTRLLDGQKSLDQQMAAQIRETLGKLSDAYHVAYPEGVMDELSVQIFIAAQRCRFLKYVEYDGSINVREKFLDMASQIGDVLAKLWGVPIPDAEIHNIAVSLQLRSLKEQAGEKDFPYREAIDRIFLAVRDKFGLELAGYDNMEWHLALHIPQMIERCRNRIWIDNPILNDIFRDYPMAVDVANIAAQILEQRFEVKLNSNEFAYLALYFNMCVSEYTQRRKRTIILVCPGGRAEETMYFQGLKTMFGNFVRELETCESKKLREMQFTGDEVVISTVKLPFLPSYVKVILAGRDVSLFYSDIMAALTSLPVGSFNIDEFMDESKWQAGVKLDTPESYYEFLFDRLCELQVMDFGEAQTLYENIEAFGQEVGSQVAFIRSENRFLTPFVHVTVAAEPFLWETQYVRVLIFANLSDGEYEFRNGLYTYLGNWYRYRDKVDEIIKNPDYGRMMEFIRGVPVRHMTPITDEPSGLSMHSEPRGSMSF